MLQHLFIRIIVIRISILKVEVKLDALFKLSPQIVEVQRRRLLSGDAQIRLLVPQDLGPAELNAFL